MDADAVTSPQEAVRPARRHYHRNRGPSPVAVEILSIDVIRFMDDNLGRYIGVVYLHFCHRHNNLWNETEMGLVVAVSSVAATVGVLRKKSTGGRSSLPWSAPEFISNKKRRGPLVSMSSVKGQ